MSWTQLFHLGGSGPTPSPSTSTLPATWLGRKGRKKKRKEKKTDKKLNRENPRTNGKSKPKYIKSHKEACIHTLTKREKRKKNLKIKLKKGREQPNQ